MENKQTVFACDIGGSKLLCGFVTKTGKIVDTIRTPLYRDICIEELEDYIEASYQTLLSRNPDYQVVSCGMTIPGLADPKSGIWVHACFSGISQYAVVERMGKRLNLSVYIENDANACAWAEKVYGACRDCDNFLWVTVSNGVGGGLIIDGKIYEGPFGGAGEIGHVVVERNGLVCPCGHKGCLEAMAAGPGIAKRYLNLTGTSKNAAQIADAAREGDADALAIIHETAEYIGNALGKAASLMNLERYVLGGGVMQSYDLMQEDIRKAFSEEAFENPNRKAEILQSALKYEAGLMGAAAVAWYTPWE